MLKALFSLNAVAKAILYLMLPKFFDEKGGLSVCPLIYFGRKKCAAMRKKNEKTPS